MKEILTTQKMIENIQHLYETDVGDFKRKATLYLNRFQEEQGSVDLKKQLEDIKNEILYKELNEEHQRENIESLRFLLIDRLKTFKH